MLIEEQAIDLWENVMEEGEAKSEIAELQIFRDIGFTEFQAQHILFFARENAKRAWNCKHFVTKGK